MKPRPNKPTQIPTQKKLLKLKIPQNQMIMRDFCGLDGTRTRDLLRDRQAF